MPALSFIASWLMWYMLSCVILLVVVGAIIFTRRFERERKRRTEMRRAANQENK